MSKRKQKLEITWIESQNPSSYDPSILLEFASDSEQEDSPVLSYQATLSVCNLPRCGCSNVYFEWKPCSPGTPAAMVPPPRDFWFILDEKKTCSPEELEQDPNTLRLARILEEELTDEQRRSISLTNRAICQPPRPKSDATNLVRAAVGANSSTVV